MQTTPAASDEIDPYGDERGRVYKASGGSRRNPMLLFIPHPSHPRKSELDRLFPYIHVQFVDIRKDGTELFIEFGYLTIVITGRNLRSVALAIGAHACSRLEAFDDAQRDMPTTRDEPFIVSIESKKEPKGPPAKPLSTVSPSQ